jgi:hypothetical protein
VPQISIRSLQANAECIDTMFASGCEVSDGRRSADRKLTPMSQLYDRLSKPMQQFVESLTIINGSPVRATAHPIHEACCLVGLLTC